MYLHPHPEEESNQRHRWMPQSAGKQGCSLAEIREKASYCASKYLKISA
jgi:hypothetical protein